VTCTVTHKYWRLSRLSTVLRILPYKWLLERPNTLSFASLPISVEIDLVMLLFCRALQQGETKKNLLVKKEHPTQIRQAMIRSSSLFMRGRTTRTHSRCMSGFRCLGRACQRDSCSRHPCQTSKQTQNNGKNIGSRGNNKVKLLWRWQRQGVAVQ
jgi:hypothetical protein